MIRAWMAICVINNGRKSAPTNEQTNQQMLTKELCLTTKLALSRAIIKNMWRFFFLFFPWHFFCAVILFGSHLLFLLLSSYKKDLN